MFEETLEERPVATSAASPGEPAVKALGVGYRAGKAKGDEWGASLPM